MRHDGKPSARRVAKTATEAHWAPRNPDQHLFHEDEIIEVLVTKVAMFPKIRYPHGLLTIINDIRTAQDIKG